MQELASYPGIKYFDAIQQPQPDISKDYDVKFLATESEIKLTKVETVFEESFLKHLIEKLKQMPSIFDYKDGVRQIIFNKLINFHPVKFDEKGKINVQDLVISDKQSNDPIIQEKEQKSSDPIVQEEAQKRYDPIIHEAAQIGIERFAKELAWKNEQHFIGMNIIRYNLPREQSVDPVRWHSDVDTHHSLVILLEDPSDQDGWEGGNFCFTGRRTLVDDVNNKNLFYSLHKSVREQLVFRPATPIWEIAPTANNGVLFSNIGTIHTVTPMKAFSKNADFVQRTILTFFEGKPEEERVFIK